MYRRSRLDSALYTSPQHDWTEIASAASTDVTLERVLDRRYYLPMAWGNDWVMEGPEVPALGATGSREIRDAACAVNTNAAGGLTVEMSPDIGTTLTNYFPGNAIDCQEYPNGPTGFRVIRSLLFEVAAGAISSTNIVDNDVIAGGAITDPSKVTPWITGVYAEHQAGMEVNAIQPLARQNSTTGVVESVTLGGTATVKRWVRVFEVQWNCKVGRANLTGAELQAQLDTGYSRFVPNEVITQAQIDAGDIYRSFFDPSDDSTGVTAGVAEYEERIRYTFRVISPFTFPAAETSISVQDMVNFETIGPAKGYDGSDLDDTDTASGQISLVNEIDSATGTAFVRDKDELGYVFGHYIVPGSGTNQRRAVVWRPPAFLPSSNGKVTINGHPPSNDVDYAATDEFQIYWLDTDGLNYNQVRQWVGIRAVELGFDPDVYDNGGPTTLAQLDSGIGQSFTSIDESDTDRWFGTLEVLTGNRVASNNGKAGWSRTRFYLKQGDRISIGWQQFQSNILRSLQIVAESYDLNDMVTDTVARFTGSVTGDAQNGVSIDFTHASGDVFTTPVTSIEINGVDIPVQAGATTTTATIVFAWADFINSGLAEKVPVNTAINMIPKSATETGGPTSVTVPLGTVPAGSQYGNVRLGSANARAASVWTTMDGLGHSVAVNDTFFVESTNEVLSLTTGGMPEPTSAATAGEIRTWSVARQEWSPLESCTFSAADTDKPVFTTGVNASTVIAQGTGGTITGHVVTDASLPLTYSATINGSDAPTFGFLVDTNTGDVTVPTGLPDGNYAFVLRATDTNGNFEESSGVITIAAAGVVGLADSTAVDVYVGARPGWGLTDLDTGNQIEHSDYPTVQIQPNGQPLYTGTTVLNVDYEEFTP